MSCISLHKGLKFRESRRVKDLNKFIHNNYVRYLSYICLQHTHYIKFTKPWSRHSHYMAPWYSGYFLKLLKKIWSIELEYSNSSIYWIVKVHKITFFSLQYLCEIIMLLLSRIDFIGIPVILIIKWKLECYHETS